MRSIDVVAPLPCGTLALDVALLKGEFKTAGIDELHRLAFCEGIRVKIGGSVGSNLCWGDIEGLKKDRVTIIIAPGNRTRREKRAEFRAGSRPCSMMALRRSGVDARAWMQVWTQWYIIPHYMWSHWRLSFPRTTRVKLTTTNGYKITQRIHESTSSANIAVFGTPSSLMRPRYIPGQFKGIATISSFKCHTKILIRFAYHYPYSRVQ